MPLHSLLSFLGPFPLTHGHHDLWIIPYAADKATCKAMMTWQFGFRNHINANKSLKAIVQKRDDNYYRTNGGMVTECINYQEGKRSKKINADYWEGACTYGFCNINYCKQAKILKAHQIRNMIGINAFRLMDEEKSIHICKN